MGRDRAVVCSWNRGTALLLGLLMGLGGCADNGGGEQPDGAPPAADSGHTPAAVPDPFHDPFVTWVLPLGGTGLTTAGPTVVLQGVVAGAAASIAVDVTRAGGAKETIGIPLATRFETPAIALEPGDNTLVLRARFVDPQSGKESMGQDEVVVTRTPELELGPLELSPAEVFADETTPQLVTLHVGGERADETAKVEAVAADAADPTTASALFALNDSGQDGDVKAGDGIYSGRHAFAPMGPGEHGIRARLSGATGAWTALSAATSATVLSPISSQQVDAWIALLTKAGDSFDQLVKTQPREQARAALLAQLQQEPGVAEAGLTASGDAVWWEMDSGLQSVLVDTPAGTRGSGGALVSKLTALLFNPFDIDWHDFSNCEKANTMLARSACPELGPVTKQYDQLATVEAFKKVHEYGTVVIDAHGTYGKGNQVVIVLSELVNGADFNDPAKRYKHEGAMGRMMAVWLTRGGQRRQYYGVTAKFVAHHNRPFPKNSLFYAASCYSTGNKTMARAFLRNGGGVFAGYTHSVGNAYTLAIADTFFRRLVEGQDTVEARADALSRAGHVDPSNAACRFTLVPGGRRINLSKPCNGFTRVTNEADYVWGHPGTRVSGHSEYYSNDQIVVSPWDLTGNTFIMKHVFKSCSFHYKHGDPQDPIEVNAGFGTAEQEYHIPTTPWDVKLGARLGVRKMVLDRQARKVQIFSIVEDAYDAQYEAGWVDHLNQDWLGTWYDTGDCVFEGAPYDMPTQQSLWKSIEFDFDDISVTDHEVKGTYSFSNDKGSVMVEFEYRLP